MKKVLHLTHTDINSDSRILKEMEALSNAGYEVSGIGINGKSNVHRGEIKFIATINSLSLMSKKIRKPRILRHILMLFELLFKIIPLVNKIRPDFIHCHDTTVLPIAAICKIFTNAGLIYDAHELESNRNGMSALEGKFTFFAEKFIWKLIDGLIVVSPSIQLWYKDNIGDKISTIVFNSPLVSADINECERSNYFREKFKIPPNEKIFLYIGIVGPGRGIELLLDAFASSELNSHVVFLGYGEYEELIKSYSLKNINIHYHCPVPHAQVVSIAKSADYGLCLIENISLSDYYCLPNKLFEYCFSGIPVLASNFPDIARVVDKHKLGIVCDISINSIIENIKTIEILSPKFEFIDIDILSWESQANHLLSFYKEIEKEI